MRRVPALPRVRRAPLVACLLLCAPAFASPIRPVEDGEISDRLRRAEAFSAARQWGEAAAQYEIVLARGAGRLHPADEAGRKEDAARRALRALLAWPAEGRRAAAEAWKDPAGALLAREPPASAAERLADLFPLSEAAVNGLPRAILAAIEAGRVGRAADLLERLERLDPAAYRTLSEKAAIRLLRGEAPPAPPPRAILPERAAPAWTVPLVPPFFTAEAHLARGIAPRSPAAALAGGGRIFLLEPARTACLERATGALLWESSLLGSRSASTPPPCGGILADGLLLRLWDGRLAALDRITGKVRWTDGRTPGIDRRVVSPPAAEGGRVYAAWIEPRPNRETAAGIACLRVPDGRVLWETELGSVFHSHLLDCGAAAPAPLASGGSLYCATGTGLLARLDAETGRILWLRPTPVLREAGLDAARWSAFSRAEASLRLDGGALVAASPESPVLLAADPADGRTRWERPRGEGERVPAADAPVADRWPGEGGDLLVIRWDRLERIPAAPPSALPSVPPPPPGPSAAAEAVLKAATEAERAGREKEAIAAWCMLLRSRAPIPWGPLELPAGLLARSMLSPSAARLEAARAAEPGLLDPPFVARDGAALADEARRLASEGRADAARGIWEELAAASRDPALRLQARREAMSLALASRDLHGAAHHARALLGMAPDAAERRDLEAVLSAPPLRPFRDLPLPEEPRRLLWHLRGVDGPVSVTRMWEAAGLLYTYGSEGLCRRDARTGAVRWSSATGEPERLLADGAGTLYALRGLEILRLDPGTGEGRWILPLPPTGGESEGPAAPRHARPDRPLRFASEPPEGASPERIEWAAPLPGALAVRTGERRLAAIDPATGNLRWDRTWDEPVRAAAREGATDLWAASGRTLHRIGADGKTLREVPLPFAAQEAGLFADGTPWIRGERGIWTEAWTHAEARRGCRELRADPSGERLLVLSESEQEGIEVLCLSRRDGRILWVRQPPGLRRGTLSVFADAALLVGIDGHKVSTERLELADGRLAVRRLLGGAPKLASPAVLPAGRFAAVWDPASPFVDWVDLSSGESVRELRPFGPAPLSVVSADGALLIHAQRGISAYGEGAPALEEVLAASPKGSPVEPRRGAFALAALQLSQWRAALAAASRDLEEAPEDLPARERLAAVREAAALREPETIRLPRFARPPRIDGILDDGWPEPGRVELARRSLIERIEPAGKAWKGPPDLSARLYAAWDDDFLYLAVEATDDVVVPTEGLSEPEGLAKGDCLIVHLDPQDEGLFGADAGDRLVGLALRVPRFAPVPREAVPPGAYAARRAEGGRQAIYEMAIPWAYLRTRALSGSGRSAPRLNLALADDDGDGVRQVLTLGPGMDLGRFRAAVRPESLAGLADPGAWLRGNGAACPAPPLFARLLLE